MTVRSAPHLHAVILAGGSGTRLWPLSTRDHPKQFLSVGGGASLLQQTWARLASWVPETNGWVVCGQGHVAGVRQHLPRLPPSQILAEPEAKNTAAAIALAALHLLSRDPAAIMAVLPADHYIPEADWPAFRENLEAAAALAEGKRMLLTLGIKPNEAATGYGYIERGEGVGGDSAKAFRVRAFHEKPDPATARRYAADPNFFWNSGMFIWKAGVFLEELQKHRPKTFEALESLRPFLGKSEYPRKAAEIFSSIENISVDYAVMERSEQVAVIPAAFGWDDVGALTSLIAMTETDARGNSLQGEVISHDASGNLVLGKSKPIALLGVKDLMVIEGEKAILIAPKDRVQEVRAMVQFLKDTGREDLL